MTTNTQKPYIIYEGDGSLTTFTFAFSIVEDLDLLVLVDNVLLLQYSGYTVESVTDDGGTVEFTEAPADDSQVIILRQTTITQNVDYETNEPFQVDTHEWNLDKITYILQELLGGAGGGIDGDGNPIYITFDLDAEPGANWVTITNSGGTDARIPSWVSGTLAGVFHGEIDVETNLPADESATSKPDGYVWLGY